MQLTNVPISFKLDFAKLDFRFGSQLNWNANSTSEGRKLHVRVTLGSISSAFIVRNSNYSEIQQYWSKSSFPISYRVKLL